MDSNSNGDPRWHDTQEVSVTSNEWCATVHFIHTKDDDAERDQGHISLDFHVSVLPLRQIKPRQWETDQVSTSTSQMIKGLQTLQLPLFGTNPRNSHMYDTQTKCIWCVPFLLGPPLYAGSQQPQFKAADSWYAVSSVQPFVGPSQHFETCYMS